MVTSHDSSTPDNSTPSILPSDRPLTSKRVPAQESRRPGGAYVCFAPGLTQELYATAPGFFGGIAFAPDADVLVSFCDNRYFPGGPTSLRRFDAQSTGILNGSPVHPQVPGSPFASLAGCGLVNGAGGSVYSNTPNIAGGVVQLNPNTGAVLAGPFGGRGNGLGIALDPQTGYLVYVGYDSEILFVSPDGESAGVFSNATRDTTLAKVVDGIFFEPDGEFLFLGAVSPDAGRDEQGRRHRAEHFVSGRTDFISCDDPQVVVTTNTDGTLYALGLSRRRLHPHSRRQR